MSGRCEWCQCDYAAGTAHTHRQCEGAYAAGAAAEREACARLLEAVWHQEIGNKLEHVPLEHWLQRSARLIRARGEGEQG